MLSLYIVDSNWSEAAVIAAYASLLPTEKQRVDRMCETGKAQLIISLFVRRPLLAKATGLSDLAFNRDRKGKLSLAADLSWCFNVADTPGCVVLAVTRNQAVGVDVEEASRSIANLDDFITACLSQAEQQVVAKLDAAEKKSWVLRAWVLKEAYTKRLGLGLSFGFKRITASPDVRRPALVVDGEGSKGADCLWLSANYLDHYIGLSVEGRVADLNIQLMKEPDFSI